MVQLKSIVFLMALFFITISNSYAQNVSGNHIITRGNLSNEYNIKTTVLGLEGVDIARIKYFIPKKHTYKPVASNSYLSKVEDEYIKFYIMSVPVSGMIEVELSIVILEKDSLVFPVEFQYSKNDNKEIISLSALNINSIVDAESIVLYDDANAVEEAAAIVLANEATVIMQKEQEIAKVEAERLADKEQADRLFEEEALAKEQLALQKKEAETVALLKAQKEEERLEIAKRVALAKEEQQQILAVKLADRYGVQLFALSKYTDQKVKDFCTKANLDYARISTLKVNGVTKVRYGSVSTKEAGSKLRKQLLSSSEIKGGFVVKL